MAVKKKEAVKSYQEQLNDIDKEIEVLYAKRKELANLALKEINNAVEMPLHQLNLIASIGYEAAKKKCAKSWVE